MEEVRQALSVLVVLGLLAACYWWLRRKGLAQFAPRLRSNAKGKSMQVVERLALTPQHSLHLVRVGGRIILVAAAPGGCSIMESVQETVDRGSEIG